MLMWGELGAVSDHLHPCQVFDVDKAPAVHLLDHTMEVLLLYPNKRKAHRAEPFEGQRGKSLQHSSREGLRLCLAHLQDGHCGCVPAPPRIHQHRLHESQKGACCYWLWLHTSRNI